VRLTYSEVHELAESGAYGGDRELSAETCALLLCALPTFLENVWNWSDGKENWDAIQAMVSLATFEVMYGVLGNGNGLEEMSIAIVRDEKSTGTPGGTFTTGAYRTRDLNSIHFDGDGIVSLDDDLFTLQPGTYLIFARAPAYRIGECNLRLWDNTGFEVVLDGASNNASNSAAYHAICTLLGFVEPTVETDYLLGMKGESTQGTNGMGKEGNGAIEIFTEILIIKVA
jgi:hypothetical protein